MRVYEVVSTIADVAAEFVSPKMCDTTKQGLRSVLCLELGYIQVKCTVSCPEEIGHSDVEAAVDDTASTICVEPHGMQRLSVSRCVAIGWHEIQQTWQRRELLLARPD